MEERAVARIVGDVAAAQEALQEAALLAGTPREALSPPSPPRRPWAAVEQRLTAGKQEGPF